MVKFKYPAGTPANMSPTPPESTASSERSMSEDHTIKRQKTSVSPKPRLLAPSTPKTVNGEHQGKWMSGLSQEELVGLAKGAVWQIGDYHNDYCTVCNRGGTSRVDCYNCPRSYHRKCLNPPMHGNFKVDTWYCPNCTSTLATEVGGPIANKTSFETKRFVDGRDVLPILDRSSDLRSTDPLMESRDSQNSMVAQRRSRYTTLPSHVDAALGVINRELEAAHQSSSLIQSLTTEIKTLKQTLQIERQNAILSKANHSPNTELNELRLKHDRLLDALHQKQGEIDGLRDENERLKKEAEKGRVAAERMEVEMDKWRENMRAFLSENK